MWLWDGELPSLPAALGRPAALVTEAGKGRAAVAPLLYGGTMHVGSPRPSLGARSRLLVAVLAVGCGARTGIDVPVGGEPAVDAATPVEDAGFDGRADAGRPPGGGTFRPSPPTRLAAGMHHACAVVDGGHVRCWGRNDDGQVRGPPTTGDLLLEPTEVAGIDDAVEVTAGATMSCARHESGEVSCWGTLGPRGTEPVAPTRVVGLTGAVELTSGSSHGCARRSDDSVVCWGDNGRGQLGDGTTTRRDVPTPVAGLGRVEEISAGWDHTCARSGTAVYCWGDNDDAQIGDETFTERWTPTRVAADLDAVEIAAGWSHTCARTSYGEVFCWGRYWGEETLMSPDALHRLVPTLVEGAEDVVEIDAGGGHTCIRDRDGQVSCWGRDRDGQLGDASAARVTGRTEPAPVLDLGPTDEIAAGWLLNVARERSGRVLWWGTIYTGSSRTLERAVRPQVVRGL